jgi:hypothetical protein
MGISFQVMTNAPTAHRVALRRSPHHRRENQKSGGVERHCQHDQDDERNSGNHRDTPKQLRAVCSENLTHSGLDTRSWV